mmetsp:Transcript_16762/g.30356  ORF Transcript_16762/g.30356 Transcript_16762/m.30356 type:complete len:210 (+) Transcript_16762:164-793(+)
MPKLLLTINNDPPHLIWLQTHQLAYFRNRQWSRHAPRQCPFVHETIPQKQQIHLVRRQVLFQCTNQMFFHQQPLSSLVFRLVHPTFNNVIHSVLPRTCRVRLVVVLHLCIQAKRNLAHGLSTSIQLQHRDTTRLRQFSFCRLTAFCRKLLAKPGLFLGDAFVRLVYALGNVDNTALGGLRPFDGGTDPVHCVGGKAEASVRFVFFSGAY